VSVLVFLVNKIKSVAKDKFSKTPNKPLKIHSCVGGGCIC
jgi:hypothetical protein